MRTELIRGAVSCSLAFLLSACGVTVKRDANVTNWKPHTLAVLPTDYPTGIARERVDYLRIALLRELKSSGYVLLDDSAFRGACPEKPCKNLAALSQQFSVDAFVDFQVDSARRTNFVAGYYNAISGKLRVIDSAWHEILSVDNTESERGGLLFNSGQIFQGIISSVNNSESDAFNNLGDKFIKSLVLKLPAPSDGAKGLAQSAAVQIESTSVTISPGARYQVCALGTPKAQANLVIDKRRAHLREVKAGQYCGVFLLGGLVQPGSHLFAELISPYGIQTQKNIEIGNIGKCMPEGLVQKQEQARRVVLRLSCEDYADKKRREDCEAKLKHCQNAQLLVFRSPSDAGPFQRAGELPVSGFADTNPEAAEGKVYTVLAIGSDGTPSNPVAINEKLQK